MEQGLILPASNSDFSFDPVEWIPAHVGGITEKKTKKLDAREIPVTEQATARENLSYQK
jgi:hypothetical protein